MGEEAIDTKATPRSDSSAGSMPRKGSVTVERQLPDQEWQEYRSTKRGLTRHVQLMAIGGSIGTGLFVGIGGPLSNAGPLNVLLGYLAWGLLFICPCCLCAGEMMARLPIRGSIFELASRFVDPALGFSLGWTYFFAGAMLVCVEYSAVATVMQFWIPAEQVNPAAWIAMALVVCYLLDVVAVGWYGESEFIMAGTKILLIVGLILLTFITMVGGNPKSDAHGFRYWTDGNAMHPYYTTGTTGRFLAFFITLRYAAFTVGSAVTVFYWFVDLTTTALILSYVFIFMTSLGWYYACKAQGIPRTKGESPLPYISPLAPYSSWAAIAFGMLVVLFIGFDSFVPVSVQGFITNYVALAFSVVLFLGWKIVKKTAFVRPADVDLVSGKQEVDDECAHWEEGGIEENEKRRLAGLSFGRRCWERIW